MSSPEAWGLFLHLWGGGRIPWQDSAYFLPVQGFPRFSSLVLCLRVGGWCRGAARRFFEDFSSDCGGKCLFLTGKF